MATAATEETAAAVVKFLDDDHDDTVTAASSFGLASASRPLALSTVSPSGHDAVNDERLFADQDKTKRESLLDLDCSLQQEAVYASSSSPSQEEEDDDEVGVNATQDKFGEWLMPGLKMEMKLRNVLASRASEYQKVEILDTFFGKTLVLDGYTQSTQFDEFAYHESLVHPALLQVAALGGTVRRVFIGGGGELATARHVLQHNTVQEVVMVDLDRVVVDLCRTHLPEWGGDLVRQDPRFTLSFGDAYQYLMEYDGDPFDVIIMDISDPVEAGPGIALYTQEFYTHAATLLSSPHGVLVTQAGAADAVPYQIIPPTEHCDNATGMSLGPICNTLVTVFERVLPYSTHIASSGGDWGFVMASQSKPPTHSSNNNHHHQLHPQHQVSNHVDWKDASCETIDALIETQIKGGTKALFHYDGETHRRMFALTKPLRKYLAEETRIMTKKNPIYTF